MDPVFVEFQLAVAGRYSIDRELGRGGMGIVYLAREVQLDRPVAIKLLPPARATDPLIRERFVREARMAARLSHPNIIPIFAVDESDGFVFYVMAYVDGESLGERVRRRGPLAASEAVRVLREVAWALGHAHSQGLVHRDVKPDNILIETGSGRALVMDFGIAAAEGTSDQGGVAGTPEFMSPEQVLGGDIDARSDLYGLGATAFFVCSGRLPFEGKGAVEVLAKQVATPAPALSSVGAPVPRRLARLIESCLAKDPAQRPASAQALGEQFALSVEQRNEVPAALRAFVKRDSRVSGPGFLIISYVTLASAVPIVMNFGGLVGGAIMATTLLGIPFLGMTLLGRKVLRKGFTQADVGHAFRSEIDQLKEEFTSAGLIERPVFERWVTRILFASGAVSIVAGFLPMVVPGLPLFLREGAVATTTVGVLTFIAALGVRQFVSRNRPFRTAQAWMNLWMGRIGRAAFALARKLGGRSATGAAMTHRPTELAIGMAAEELFAALPKETRQSLGDVPTILAQLQRDATELRAHHDRLQEALADAEGASEAAGRGVGGAGDAYADLRELRDEMGRRLRDVVGALETTRLDLLRLHAGAMTVDGVTTHFGLAEDVSAAVRRLLEARGEIERYLRFPDGSG